MEDKVFDLFEKVYIELQETKKELKGDIKNIDNRITKLEIKIEQDISKKIDSLYEGNVLTNQRLENIENKLDEISEKV